MLRLSVLKAAAYSSSSFPSFFFQLLIINLLLHEQLFSDIRATNHEADLVIRAQYLANHKLLSLNKCFTRSDLHYTTKFQTSGQFKMK